MDLKRRILVIDDDQSVCDMIARTLEKEGYEVFTETRSQEGVLKAGEILPDLVFISLLLGTTNGLKVSKELHSVETLRKVPVVMLISYTGELDPKYTVTIGVVDVLVKPLSERDILSKTEAVLGPYTPQNRAAEEVIPEISAGNSIGEAFEQEEGYVLERGEETETGISARGDAWRDIRGAIDDEMQQRQEPVQEAANASGGLEDISAEPLDESGFERAAVRIAEETGNEETGSASMYEEEQTKGEDLEMQRKDEVDLPFETEKRGDRKNILMVGATLALIAVIGIGIYLGLQFFFAGRDRGVVSPSLQKAPVMDKSDLQESKTGSLPAETTPRETKAQEPAVAVPQQNLKKEEIPGSPVDAKGKGEGAASKNKSTVKEVIVSGAPDKGLFFVQIGFFVNPKNAESLAEKMKQKGYEVFIKEEKTAAGKMSFRVMAGKFGSRKEALEQSEVIFRKEGIRPLLYKE